jgi:hypothetical protein
MEANTIGEGISTGTGPANLDLGAASDQRISRLCRGLFIRVDVGL